MKSSLENNLLILRHKWIELAFRVGFDAETAETAWIFLKDHYQQRNRQYHNFDHISQSLQYMETYSSEIGQVNELAYAIWFHDVIYKAYKGNNEALSAKVAVKFLPASFSHDSAIHIHDLILATKQHIPKSDHQDMKWMLDIDLAILGQDVEIYQAYTKAIRKEYRMYPNFLFQPGRKKVIQHFLKREKLYYTDVCMRLWEQQARDNLEWELSQL